MLFALWLACTPEAEWVSRPIGATPVTTTPPPVTDPTRFDAVLAAAAAELTASDAGGLSIAIWEDGEVVFAAGVGTTRPGGGAPITPSTRLQLGSTTKMYTAARLLQLVDAGHAELDQPLAAVFPDLDMASDPGSFDVITLRHALAHQGAFIDEVDWTHDPDDAALAAWAEDYASRGWLMAEPGRFWNYSNPGYSFAGLAIERLDPAGRPFAEQLTDEVFAPLGMTRTTFDRDAVAADGDYAVGTGYTAGRFGELSYGEVTIDDLGVNASARPAGGMTWATPTDQLAMAGLLIDGAPGVLSGASAAALRTPQAAMDPTAAYGLGVMLYDGFALADGYHTSPLWEHGGNTLAHTSAFYVLPEQRFAVSILSSGYGQSFIETAVAALSLADLGPAGEAPALTVDPDRFDAHVGTYVDRQLGALTITRDGDALRVEWPDLAGYGYGVEPELTPLASDWFLLFVDGQPLDVRFIEGDTPGQSAWIVNRSFVGSRDGDATIPAAPPPPPAWPRLGPSPAGWR